MKRPKYLSAINRILVIHPDYFSQGIWHLASFDLNGKWKSSTICNSETEAIECRREMFKYHRKLAKERFKKVIKKS